MSVSEDGTPEVLSADVAPLFEDRCVWYVLLVRRRADSVEGGKLALPGGGARRRRTAGRFATPRYAS